MDEIDNIIIQFLTQVGCKLETGEENQSFGLSSFTPNLLVGAVCSCLREINPEIMLPKTLPENMAQRFTVAASLAEECRSCGYSGDIGYQTFLYVNVVDVRRLFMFLIEKFPKDQNYKADKNTISGGNEFGQLIKDINTKITVELKLPWTPQYSRDISNKKLGTRSPTVQFLPLINLHINQAENRKHLTELSYQIPNVFQQCSSGGHDLVSSVLHKNAIDAHRLFPLQCTRPSVRFMSQVNYSLLTQLITSDVAKSDNTKESIYLMPIKSLISEIDSLKNKNELCINARKMSSRSLTELSRQRLSILSVVENLTFQTIFREKVCVILESPEDNINKLEGLIIKTEERRSAAEKQWQQHRETAFKQMGNYQTIRKSKNLENVQEIRKGIRSLESTLKIKTMIHGQLAEELKKRSLSIANRKDYTRRIYEFVGNIRKQRHDIYKVLDDTRDLQKQINSVSAQLQRQFNYTDDLLFQSAKHDLHTKRAYKLLAFLHISCNEICDMVSRTGQFAKESRDLESQVNREGMCNAVSSLQNITIDIEKFKLMIKTMQFQISSVENEIHFDEKV